MTLTKLLNTNQAVTYLRIEHGYVTTKATLETRRCRGGGAAYLRIKGKVYYTERQLNEWLADNSVECVNTNYSK